LHRPSGRRTAVQGELVRLAWPGTHSGDQLGSASSQLSGLRKKVPVVYENSCVGLVRAKNPGHRWIVEGCASLRGKGERSKPAWYSGSMLESVTVSNFRCFSHATVRLGPLTVIVGPNASGKTALLRAITARDLRAPRDVRRGGDSAEARIVWRLTDGQERTMRIRDGGQDGTAWSSGQYLRLDASLMRRALQAEEAHMLKESGENLVNLVASLPRREQAVLSKELSRLIPVVSDFTIRPFNSGMLRIMFQDRWSEAWFEADDVSDGTILTLGLLTLRHQRSVPNIVAIEEPEHGLHPFLLGELIRIFREIATGTERKQGLQIVITTQSSELLEFVEPSEVRFLNRNTEDGSVSIEEAPTNTENWQQAYDEHQRSLGSLWLSGSIGGVPTS
jgi:hypothetical protein